MRIDALSRSPDHQLGSVEVTARFTNSSPKLDDRIVLDDETAGCPESIKGVRRARSRAAPMEKIAKPSACMAQAIP